MFHPALYFHTLRYLRPVQVYGRLWHRFYRPTPQGGAVPPVRPLSGSWILSPRPAPSLIRSRRFRFLNEEHEITAGSDWNHPEWPKLWLYNLHYFHDLNAEGSADRREWHQALIHRWIQENPPGKGTGWEPYPLSLRVVNWIKWALRGNSFSPGALESLALQARFLRNRLEFHILGNHLLANAKALVFAGLFFQGEEAEAWLAKGMSILARELPEQILGDGGHFERSPMYHSIVLEDLLDLINLLECYDSRRTDRRLMTGAARDMLAWLEIMTHPDHQIVLFNDAAFGIAPPPGELYAYADRLGVYDRAGSPSENHTPDTGRFSSGPVGLIHLKSSGYIRVENEPLTAVLDAAPLGPDYLPGHGHADTLSFELSFGNQRVVVDSGVSLYEKGAERMRQRGTAAHNTIVLDGKDSSEIWGGFRVARRAKPFGLEIRKDPYGLAVCCAHDGYRRLPGKPVHRREWRFGERSLAVHDFVEGPFREAIGRIHLHPQTAVKRNGSGFQILLPDQKEISCRIEKGQARLVPASYHPEFGISLPNSCLEIKFTGPEALVVFSW